MDQSELLANLSLALLAAGISGVIAARLRQSVILGYVIAGIAIGPYTPGWVADVGTVDALAEIGIVLLLFVTGMDVSTRELARLGRVAVVGALVQVAAVLGLGYTVAIALGWGSTSALFLGAAASNSSSTVLSKVLGERGEGASRHGRIALTWSAVQDLSTVVLIVLLTGIADGGGQLAANVATDLAKAAAFLVVTVPLGGRVLPPLFEHLRALRQQEVFVLAAAVLALLTAYTATLFGLSPAVGAFVAGVVLSESEIRHEVLSGILPLRDIFAGLFFVSVGMFVDPRFVLENAGTIVVLWLVIVPLKGVLIAGLARLLRVSTRRSVLVGGGLAQSAEFSFLLASVGSGLGALSDSEFSTILSATAISTLAAPWMLGAVTPLSRRLEQLERRDLTRAPGTTDPVTTLEGHTIVCGHGRVGRVVTAALRAQGCQVAVVDLDPAGVIELRQEGVAAFLGSADNDMILERAGIGTAALLVVAVPERGVARRLVQLARARNASVRIVVRTHEEAERVYLEANGVDEAVFGELELALEMARYALRESGVDPAAADEYVDELRHQPA